MEQALSIAAAVAGWKRVIETLNCASVAANYTLPYSDITYCWFGGKRTMPSLVLGAFSGRSRASTSERRVWWLYLVRSCIPAISVDVGKNAVCWYWPNLRSTNRQEVFCYYCSLLYTKWKREIQNKWLTKCSSDNKIEMFSIHARTVLFTRSFPSS